jgi:outer membrane protein OmpA-like peptidoglycan-associated protein
MNFFEINSLGSVSSVNVSGCESEHHSSLMLANASTREVGLAGSRDSSLVSSSRVRLANASAREVGLAGNRVSSLVSSSRVRLANASTRGAGLAGSRVSSLVSSSRVRLANASTRGAGLAGSRVSSLALSLATLILLISFALMPAVAQAQFLSQSQGQSGPRQIDRGIYFGGALGQTDLSDDRGAFMIRPFGRHSLNNKIDGEFSFGIGAINSTQYRTRLIPIDYRLNLHPFRTGIVAGRTLVSPSDFYIYAGLGVVNYHHSRIPRPDDPLTVNAGPSIPNTEFWSFDRNWSVKAPVGVGTRLWLDNDASLLVSVGYTFTGSNSLASVQSSGRDGYWGVSVGLSLRSIFGIRIAPPLPPLAPAPRPFIEAPAPPPTALPRVLVTMPTMVNFDHAMFGIDERADRLMRELGEYLRTHPDDAILLRGHTDMTGSDPVNEILGYERAWSVKTWLMSAGVAPSRVVITGLAAREPWGDNTTEAGRRLNRRVEFQVVAVEEIENYREAAPWRPDVMAGAGGSGFGGAEAGFAGARDGTVSEAGVAGARDGTVSEAGVAGARAGLGADTTEEALAAIASGDGTTAHVGTDMLPDVAGYPIASGVVALRLPPVGSRVEIGRLAYAVVREWPQGEPADIRATLDALYLALIANPSAEILVTGFPDYLPNEAANRITSAARASRIKEYLIVRGIESSRVHTHGETGFVPGMPASPVRISITRLK